MAQRARILPRDSFDSTSLRREAVAPNRAEILRRERLQAELEAREIRARLQAEVERRLAQAERETAEIRAAAERAGFEEGLARAVGERVKIALSEEQLDQRARARSIEVARLLAERLVGRSIELDESTVHDMANVVLSEVRGVRQIRFEVHPRDVDLLRQALQAAPPRPIPITVEANENLKRGDFQLRTDTGILRASLPGRLETLARALAESLG